MNPLNYTPKMTLDLLYNKKIKKMKEVIVSESMENINNN